MPTPAESAVSEHADPLNGLPLLLAVPRAAALIGVSRAAAYRLAASGELPSRRLGGRVYVVTSAIRELMQEAA